MKRVALILFIIVAFSFFVLPYLLPLGGEDGRPAAALALESGRLLQVEGVQTFIVEAGPSGGPAVVLLHGFGGSTFSWRETVPALAAAGYRVLALDLKGFGLTAKSFNQSYDHGSQAHFVTALMDEVGLDAATVAGHSMGGNVAAHMALRYPERVERVVLVDAAIVYPGEDAPGYALPGWLLELPPARRWARHILRLALNRDRFAAMLDSATYAPDFVDAEMVEGYYRTLQVEDWDLALLGIVRDSQANELPASPATLDVPTLLIWGAEDTWVPLEAGERLERDMARASLVALPETGHLPMEEQPQQFNAILLDFLATP